MLVEGRRSTSGIVVATSIPPNMVRHENGREVGQAYQRSCINSWIDAGFRILSLNFQDEISRLAPQYPMVKFISIDRDASAISGRRTPLVSDLLQVLSKQNEEIVGIINADILLLDAEEWPSIIKKVVRNAIAVAHRADVMSLQGDNFTLYRNGYDLFFFEKKNIPHQIASSFAIGLPWWDYCLPIVFSLKGLAVELITSPVGLHLEHPSTYPWSTWRSMANKFAEFVLDSAADSSPGVVTRDDLLRVIKLCRKVSLQARLWGKFLSIARRLPVLWRFAQGPHGDTNRDRLSTACVASFDFGHSQVFEKGNPE